MIGYLYHNDTIFPGEISTKIEILEFGERAELAESIDYRTITVVFLNDEGNALDIRFDTVLKTSEQYVYKWN
ncbi:MAG: hypothetical protein GX046_02465 [Tissierellia bacterium]|nr:hypothetical protein [Tissierellia bacterium]